MYFEIDPDKNPSFSGQRVWDEHWFEVPVSMRKMGCSGSLAWCLYFFCWCHPGGGHCRGHLCEWSWLDDFKRSISSSHFEFLSPLSERLASWDTQKFILVLISLGTLHLLRQQNPDTMVKPVRVSKLSSEQSALLCTVWRTHLSLTH